MSMRSTIALNAGILRAPRTGIGHYLAELATALDAERDLQLQFFNGWSWQRQLPSAPLPGYSRWSGLAKQWLPGAYRLRRLLEQQRFNAGLRHHPVALYHEPSLWPLAFDGPMVMTLHDLTHVHYPETQPADRLVEIERHAARSVQQAQRILVDSQFVAGEVAAYYAVDRDKIVVAPLGCAPRFHPRDERLLREPLQRLGLEPGKYLICVGTLEPRKNLQLALRAHERLPVSLRQRFPLVIVGMSGWRGDEFAELLQRGLAGGHVRLLGYQPDEVLAEVLAGARLLVFPSLYEGFGLPVLEAMASGIPVVLSGTASLPEVAGDSGIYVAPDDEAGCTEAIVQLIDDDRLWGSRRAAGLQRAKHFSWKNCAAITAGVYRQVMES